MGSFSRTWDRRICHAHNGSFSRTWDTSLPPRTRSADPHYPTPRRPAQHDVCLDGE
eukprot:CAMPEP_0181171506 /NCGR_PEP_ID=MMETSP1096-20121128/1945_1 /TAXON_ID=156174 ORGANISM="Chrysochromulina ericina, Strain CCMP281" /NCGR_SAMPLE_ID=MMETSP1096 /ASSEMBLY_ACC=CAM_ASM_000453 /LENGTH=55 /DNA_ID=CAMNT_0023259157 /DNA_START=1 /DNA_END=165 /DNA_ORIENTATION=+